jgi:hypothetical protein
MIMRNTLGMSFLRHQIMKRVSALLRLLTDWALFILVVLTAGLGTAWYMMDHGSNLTTINAGPWSMWTTAARADADPYTRAHFARLGALPLSTDIGETYLARSDANGDALHSSCDYEVIGRPPPQSWWSIAVFDADGQLISNPAERYAYTSETAAMLPDGRFVATLSRSASTGNWLPTGGAGKLTVVYTLMDLGTATGTGEETDDVAARLPAIELRGCR